METGKIRDKILEQRALYQQSLQAAEAEAQKIRDVIANISEQEIMLMQSILGEKFFSLSEVDLDRVKNDSAYLNECQEKLDMMIRELHSYLEAEIDVQS